jgi:hypothetical protein
VPTIIREKITFAGGSGGDRVRLRVGPADDAHDIRGLLMNRETSTSRNIASNSGTPGAGTTAASSVAVTGPSFNSGLNFLHRAAKPANLFGTNGAVRLIAIVPNATGIATTAFNPNTASKGATTYALNCLAIR